MGTRVDKVVVGVVDGELWGSEQGMQEQSEGVRDLNAPSSLFPNSATP